MVISVSIDEFLHIAWTHKMYDNEGILKMVVIRAQYLLDTSMCGPNSFIVQFEEIDHGCFGWLANNINNAQSHSECRLLYYEVVHSCKLKDLLVSRGKKWCAIQFLFYCLGFLPQKSWFIFNALSTFFLLIKIAMFSVASILKYLVQIW